MMIGEFAWIMRHVFDECAPLPLLLLIGFGDVDRQIDPGAGRTDPLELRPDLSRFGRCTASLTGCPG
jgi:hypothetical protein